MNWILKAASITLFASGAFALSGCNNNDDSNVSAHDDCNCACRAPLVGRPECVPGPAPMVEKTPVVPAVEVRPAPVVAQVSPPAPAPVPVPLGWSARTMLFITGFLHLSGANGRAKCELARSKVSSPN